MHDKRREMIDQKNLINKALSNSVFKVKMLNYANKLINEYIMEIEQLESGGND